MGIDNALQKLEQANTGTSDLRSNIIKRLLGFGHINTDEAIVLMKTIDISITTDKLEMSSGAKIVGGSDFETTDFGRR